MRTIGGSDKDCKDFDMICDKDAGVCVECLNSPGCPADQYCLEKYCVDDMCTAGEAVCDGLDVVACNDEGSEEGVTETCTDTQYCEDGMSSTMASCGADHYCEDGACKPVICDANTSYCDGNVVMQCDATGTVEQELEVCVEQVCGNGVVDDGEECDDGNVEDGDGCDSNCQKEVVCPTVTHGATTLSACPVSVPGKDVVDWYSLDHPQMFCSNTGFELAESTVLVLYQNPNGQYDLVILNDKCQSVAGGGGSVSIAVSGMVGAKVLLEDGTADSYSLDTQSGMGNFSWTWTECCSDGTAIGPLGTDFSGFDFILQVTSWSDMDALVIVDGINYETIPKPLSPLYFQK